MRTTHAANKGKPRGPDRQLKPGELRCASCQGPLQFAAAVYMNGNPFHPIGCFDIGLREWIRAVTERLNIMAIRPRAKLPPFMGTL